MLTFQYGPEGTLEVTVDGGGLAALMEVLSKLEAGDHEHLSTESWGGYSLTEEFPHADLAPIHQITISRVDEHA